MQATFFLGSCTPRGFSTFASELAEECGAVDYIKGGSGCGKSTVARAIMGIYTPTEGEIYFKDFLISEKRSYREHKKDIQRNMQVIFQDSAAALNPRMKVADIIAEPLVINRVYPDKVRLRAEVDKLLTLVGLDTSYGNKFPAEISGGQRQRVAIAQALATNRALVVYDEPTSGLDLFHMRQVAEGIRRVRERGITQVVITHDPEFALSCCTHVAVMDRGRITEAYPLEESGISRLASFFRSEYHAGEDDPSIRKTPSSRQKG